MAQTHFDAIVCGFGLAGAVLAWLLDQQGQNVLVIDKADSNASSVAPGIVNPLSGQRWVLAANYSYLAQYAKRCYRELESALRQRVYHERCMLRLLTAAQLSLCRMRQDQACYQAYIGQSVDAERLPGLHAPFGAVPILGACQLDIAILVNSLRQYFLEKSALYIGSIDHRCVSHDTEHIQVNGVSARQLIFCEGYAVSQNPWFAHLPFVPVRGEMLSLKCEEELRQDCIVVGQFSLEPMAHNLFRFGSTFEPNCDQALPTEQGRAVLRQGLEQTFDRRIKLEIISQYAGVRCATTDRHPFVGFHATAKRVGIFNGFGAKGVLTIPYYADRFVAHMLHHADLPEECRLNRACRK